MAYGSLKDRQDAVPGSAEPDKFALASEAAVECGSSTIDERKVGNNARQ
jgi:hypothetical protein